MTAAAILLAAGESERMGSPKPLLAWGRETLVEYQVRQLREAGCDPVIVVLGHRSGQIAPLVRDAAVVVNNAYREGRASSLSLGAAAVPRSASAVVILGVDQPRPASLTADLLLEHSRAGATITIPTCGGKRGHPVVVASTLLPELLTATEAEMGLRGVLARHRGATREVPCDSPIVLLDINTPQEYEDAKRRFA